MSKPEKKPTPEQRAAARAQQLLDEAQTKHNKAKLLQALASTGNVSAAAKLAGVGRRTHYEWLAADTDYAAAVADAIDEAADLLEVEARRRAVSGITEAVYHKGVQVGTLRKYSDVLLIFLLKGARPEKYAERHKHSGTGKRGAFLLEDIVGGAEPEGGK